MRSICTLFYLLVFHLHLTHPFYSLAAEKLGQGPRRDKIAIGVTK